MALIDHTACTRLADSFQIHITRPFEEPRRGQPAAGGGGGVVVTVRGGEVLPVVAPDAPVGAGTRH